MWAANFEVFTLVEQNAQIREFFANGAQHAREGMASLFAGVEEAAVDSDSVRTVGAVYYCLLLGVLAQWLLDPERAPQAEELVAGLRTIAEGLG